MTNPLPVHTRLIGVAPIDSVDNATQTLQMVMHYLKQGLEPVLLQGKFLLDASILPFVFYKGCIDALNMQSCMFEAPQSMLFGCLKSLFHLLVFE